MFVFPSAFPIPTRLLITTLALMICLGSAIFLAEGCVKRPNWEPTPGVSPKGVEYGNFPY